MMRTKADVGFWAVTAFLFRLPILGFRFILRRTCIFFKGGILCKHPEYPVFGNWDKLLARFVLCDPPVVATYLHPPVARFTRYQSKDGDVSVVALFSHVSK